MEKIIFENYPSTETPLNANNLNQLQDNVEEALSDLNEDIEESITEATEKNIITASLEQNTSISITRAWIYNKIPLDNEITNIGEKLTLSNNIVKIGTGVNHIKISGNIFARGIQGDLIGDIEKNSIETISIGYARTATTGQLIQVVFSPKIINVQENDEISLNIGSSATGTLETNAVGTYLTVEVVD